jgi:hypothetical protein
MPLCLAPVKRVEVDLLDWVEGSAAEGDRQMAWVGTVALVG